MTDRLRPLLVGAGTAAAAWTALRARPPAGSATWDRLNHRGEPVSLLAGPALVAGAVTGVLCGPASARWRWAGAVALAGAGTVGLYDDLAGADPVKGFRGHLGALRRRQLTSGSLKLAGIGATGLVSGLLAEPARPDGLLTGALVAAGANLVNLFDLRPGRALKVGLLAGAAAACGPGVAVLGGPLGAAVALLRVDLDERGMLGDAGANALGAAVGLGLAAGRSRRRRLALLAGAVALTATSERVSFSSVIDRTPVLRWADRLGRRPASR